jgi:DNA polymerase/3'-5' exonuclease PolX
MRGIARKKGYSLNEYSLTNIKTGEKVYVDTEEDIFKFLNMDYVIPQDRNI